MLKIRDWFIDIYRVWRQEFHNVFRDPGVMIFFLLLPVMYPIIYTLIYNPELVREVPVVVVDFDRTPESRKYVRSLDASEYVKIIGYASDKIEARQALWEKKCYGVLEIPDDFAKNINRGESAQVDMYADMSLLVQYKGLLTAISDVTAAVGGHLKTSNAPDIMGTMMPEKGSPMPNKGVAIGNPTAGFASFLMPGILVLVLQQSLILGIVMLGAGKRERLRATGLPEPTAIHTGTARTMIGEALCYFTIYSIMSVFDLYFIPHFFDLPQAGNYVEVNIFIIPFLLSTIFLGMIVQHLAREREDAFLLVVFFSVIFLFLSGLTWPLYAIPGFWRVIGWLVPSTWAVQGFVHISSNGASLAEVSGCYHALWLLAVIYFLIAYTIPRLKKRT
ncbi:MAG: ABC transporter permease [Muribaculaceae bacterium]